MRFDSEALEASLAALSIDHCVALAASCCERLVPNYAVFSRNERWGDVRVLESGLDQVWRAIEAEPTDAERFDRTRDRCFEVIPHTEDFSSPLVSAALDAGIAVWEAMSMWQDHDRAHGVTVARCAYETVHMHLQVREGLKPNDPGFDSAVHRHPLMMRELEKQRRDLEELRSQQSLSLHFLRRLRSLGVGKSNIDLS